MYWGYGRKGEYAYRSTLARSVERELLEKAPDTILVLLKASPEVIRRRMRESPRQHQIMKDEDVERSIDLFDEQYEETLIVRRMTLDTSTDTVAQTMHEFVRFVHPLLTDSDRLRMLTRGSAPE